MADEIAQVAQLELDVGKVLVKGSAKFITWLAQALKHMLDYTSTQIAEHKGEKKSLKEIWKICGDGEMPQVVNVDNRDLKAVLDAAEKSGLRWTRVVDLDNTDGRTPLAMPPKDAAAFSAIVATFLEKRIANMQGSKGENEELLAQLKEQRSHAEGAEAESLDWRIGRLEKAIEEAVDKIKKDEQDLAETSKGGETFANYLGSGQGTRYGEDPEMMAALAESRLENPAVIKLEECLKPVHYAGNIPENKEICYFDEETGTTIKRTFDVDEDGVAVSTFTAMGYSGEELTLNDNDKDFEKKVGNFYEGIELTRDQKMDVFSSESECKKYRVNIEEVRESVKAKHEGARTGNSFSKDAESLNKNATENESKWSASEERGEIKDVVIHAEDMFLHNGMKYVRDHDNPNVAYYIQDADAKVGEEDGLLHFMVPDKLEEKTCFKLEDGQETRIDAYKALSEIDKSSKGKAGEARQSDRGNGPKMAM